MDPATNLHLVSVGFEVLTAVSTKKKKKTAIFPHLISLGSYPVQMVPATNLHFISLRSYPVSDGSSHKLTPYLPKILVILTFTPLDRCCRKRKDSELMF
jgi:hypothetical protein